MKNRIDQVASLLPELVRLEGIVVARVQPSMLMYVNLYSTDPTPTRPSYNYANVNILPELQRISGMGRASILGNRRFSAMRARSEPDRMRAYNVCTEEVMRRSATTRASSGAPAAPAAPPA